MSQMRQRQIEFGWPSESPIITQHSSNSFPFDYYLLQKLLKNQIVVTEVNSFSIQPNS